MRYNRPIVIDLRNPIRPAMGSGIPGCVSGTSAEFPDTCSSGDSGSFAIPTDCLPGASPGGTIACASGPSGNVPTCVSGGYAGYECSTGSSPSYSSTCTTGPSFS